MVGHSLSWLYIEREELVKDRNAFGSALDMLKKRIVESNELSIPRKPLLHEWSGSRAVIGSLEMALHSTERTLSEVEDLILAIESGEVLDTDMERKN